MSAWRTPPIGNDLLPRLISGRTGTSTNAGKRRTTERDAQAEPSNEYSFEDYMNDDTEGFKTPTSNDMDDDREDSPHAAPNLSGIAI